MLFLGTVISEEGKKMRFIYPGENEASQIVFIDLRDISQTCPTMRKYFDTLRDIVRLEIREELPEYTNLEYYDFEKNFILSKAYFTETVHLPEHFWEPIKNSENYVSINPIVRNRRNSSAIETSIVPSMSSME